MAAAKLNAQEKKDLDKFTKFLALKSIQIIVQSRLGDKLQTHCKSQTSGGDWFSLAVHDLADVAIEAKKVLQGESITNQLPLCIEISLKTIDGDQMILENWSLGISPEQFDPAIRINVYNRMGLMLKSLISVTRITPAYKLSRRQGPDSFVIYYRIYLGDPQLSSLGEGYKQFKVGQLASPIGTLSLNVACRTKMTITPMQSQQGTSIMVKSDHFHSDLSPKHVRCSKQSDKKKVNLDEPMRAGAFVDTTKIKQYESDFILPEDPPFSWLLEDPRRKYEGCEMMSKSEMTDDQFSLKDDFIGNGRDCDLSENGLSINGDRRSIWTVGADDDKIMKELHCPFATAGPVGELANFYRECYNAPPLQSFNESDSEDVKSPSNDEDTLDIGKRLEMFEIYCQQYDQMVSSLCQSPNNN